MSNILSTSTSALTASTTMGRAHPSLVSHNQSLSSSHFPPAASAYPAGPPPRRSTPPSTRMPTSLESEQLSAAVQKCDVSAIVGHLYAEQQRLRHLAAVEVHAHMTQVAAELMELAASPEQLALTVIQHGDMSRRSGCWVDVPTLLLKALDEHRQLTSSPAINPQLMSLASTVLRSVILSARSFALLIRVFSIPFSSHDRWQVVEKRLSSGECREAGDLAIRLDILPQLTDERHERLLGELVRAQEVDTLHKYIEALPDSERERWLSYVVEHTADESGANNVTAACRLITHYGRRLTEYPHVAHLKAKHELWWACRIGKASNFHTPHSQASHYSTTPQSADLSNSLLRLCFCSKSDEFAHLLLTTGDTRLQRSLIRQLSKGRYEGDIERMQQWIQHSGLTNDPDVQALLEQVRLLPPQAQFSTSATTETAEERAAPTFAMSEDNITFVNDESTIARALEVLSRHTGEECVLGLDCEYLPEPYFQLGVGSSTTQLLQVACTEHTFLVDLQSLSPPTPPHVTQRLVDLLLVVLSSEAVKLGIGFDDDMRRMRADFSHLACFQVTVRRYCDLKPLLRMDDQTAAGGEGGGQRQGGRRGRGGRWRKKQSEVRSADRDESKADEDGSAALTRETEEAEQPQQQPVSDADPQQQTLQPAMMKREAGWRVCVVCTRAVGWTSAVRSATGRDDR